MRFGNLDGRAVLITDDGAIDVHTASDGRFGPSPAECYEQWADLRAWAATADAAPSPFDQTKLGAPSPAPRQSIGIGLNYAKHAAEGGIPVPEYPTTFTKFPSCLVGPNEPVALPSAGVDWEVELVVIIGALARKVSRADGWDYVAGLTVGQDLSERKVQMRPPVPQFNLGKSFPGFGPTGPWLVTHDELPNPDDLALSCAVNGETMQDSRTSDLIFSVPVLIEELSGIITLHPGDVIFTGTPEGVGMARKPPRFLAPGDEIVSTIEGIGSMTTRLVAG